MNESVLIFLFGMLIGMIIGFVLRKQTVNKKERAYMFGYLDGFESGKKYASLNLDNDDTDK